MTQQPRPVFTAFKALMQDVNAIAGPAAASYKGFFPLATVAFVGTRAGDKANSVLFLTWQRNYSVPRENPWVYLASPAEVPVEMAVPAGMKVVSVRDTVKEVAVAYQVAGSKLSYKVADDPVEVWLQPVSGKAAVGGVGCELTR